MTVHGATSIQKSFFELSHNFETRQEVFTHMRSSVGKIAIRVLSDDEAKVFIDATNTTLANVFTMAGQCLRERLAFEPKLSTQTFGNLINCISDALMSLGASRTARTALSGGT